MSEFPELCKTLHNSERHKAKPKVRGEYYLSRMRDSQTVILDCWWDSFMLASRSIATSAEPRG